VNEGTRTRPDYLANCLGKKLRGQLQKNREIVAGREVGKWAPSAWWKRVQWCAVLKLNTNAQKYISCHFLRPGTLVWIFISGCQQKVLYSIFGQMDVKRKNSLCLLTSKCHFRTKHAEGTSRRVPRSVGSGGRCGCLELWPVRMRLSAIDTRASFLYPVSDLRATSWLWWWLQRHHLLRQLLDLHVSHSVTL